MHTVSVLAVTLTVVAGGVVVGLVLATLGLLRFGVRGTQSSRVLARALHASAGRRRLARLGSATHARILRIAGGRVMGRWFGSPVLILETTGRRSGLARRTPVIYMRDGERFVVTPANAGAEPMPAWWLNLREMDSASVLVNGRRLAVQASEPEGDERERLWQSIVAMSPAVAHYQDFTQRRFPVVVLDPVTAPSNGGRNER